MSNEVSNAHFESRLCEITVQLNSKTLPVLPARAWRRSAPAAMAATHEDRTHRRHTSQGHASSRADAARAPLKRDEHPEHRPRERHERRQRARGAVEGVVVGDARCRRVPRSGEVGRTGPWARAAGGERVVEHQRRDCTGTCEYVHPPRTSHAASARGPKAESTRERAGESCR